MKFDKMEFDKEKVLTPFTAHKAKKGDVGWIGIEPKDIYHNARFRRGLVELTYVNYNLMRVGEDWSFYSKEGNGYYFYPAPYEYLQEKWVEENNLKVGDKIEVVRGWEEGENGYKTFYPDYDPLTKNFVLMVKAITNGCVVGETTNNFGTVSYDLPYFAIEKIKDEYRPFKDVEEFKPYRNEWFVHKTVGIECRPGEIGKGYVDLGQNTYTLEELFEHFWLNEKGNPAGVKL